jgi:hypothetical protein
MQPTRCLPNIESLCLFRQVIAKILKGTSARRLFTAHPQLSLRKGFLRIINIYKFIRQTLEKQGNWFYIIFPN